MFVYAAAAPATGIIWWVIEPVTTAATALQGAYSG